MSPPDPQDVFGMEAGLQLHARCVAGDPVAFDFICVAFIAPLANDVRIKYSNYFDKNQFETAAIDALMSYSKNFDSYNPQRGLSLYKYLRMAARRDFLNLRKSDNRQIGELVPLAVEDDDDAPELDIKDPKYVPFDVVLMRADSIVWQHIEQVLPDPRDQLCVYHMMEGERSTPLFVEIYGIGHLEPKDQEDEVKRHKDRIKKRLTRKLNPEEYRRHD